MLLPKKTDLPLYRGNSTSYDGSGSEPDDESENSKRRRQIVTKVKKYDMIIKKNVIWRPNEYSLTESGQVIVYREELAMSMKKHFGRDLIGTEQLEISDFLKLKLQSEEFEEFNWYFQDAIQGNFNNGKGGDFVRFLILTFFIKGMRHKYRLCSQHYSTCYNFRMTRSKLKTRDGVLTSNASNSAIEAEMEGEDDEKLHGNKGRMKADVVVESLSRCPVLIGEVKSSATDDILCEAFAQTLSFAYASQQERPSSMPVYCLVINPKTFSIATLSDDQTCCFYTFKIFKNDFVDIYELLRFLSYFENLLRR